MKWTIDWLKDYLDTDKTPQQIVETLDAIGLEVDDLIVPQLPIAAKIISAVQHPNSDHLKVLQVDDGSGELRQVVCGAPNARAGLISALAIPGVKIAGNEIVSGKIRGEVSNGMMCSEKELGLGSDHDGIIELSDIEVIGDVISAMKDLSSPVFDASITPNRPDYLSVSGIAKDLSAAKLGKYKPIETPSMFQTIGSVAVRIECEQGCPVYRLAEINDVKMGQSNSVISSRLSAIGVNPKNAAIDATNYICYDMGQPMHCFDRDHIAGNIVVRNAKQDEEFTDLFGTEHKLIDTDLVVADDKGVLAIAGVVGGLRGMTTNETKNILLESAYFDPVRVRKTSKRLGLSSDSSYRFERGINPEINGAALYRAIDIITKQCGGTVAGVVVAGQPLNPNVKIKYNPNLFMKKIGFDIPVNEQIAILKALDYVIDDSNPDWIVMPPVARVEIQIPEHIIGDLIRLYGYDNVKIDTAKTFIPAINKNDFNLGLKKKIAALGLTEHIYFGFGNDEKEQALFDKKSVMISNPITVDLNTARNNLLDNLLTVVSSNENRGYSDLNLFSLGTVFDGDEPNMQHQQLVIIRTGQTHQKHWQNRNRSVDIYDVKSDVMALFGNQNLSIKTDEVPKWAHPYRYGALYQGKNKVAEFGQLHPVIAKKYKIKTNVCIGLVEDISALPKVIKDKKISVSEFQPITRDFAFIVDDSVLANDVISAAKSVDNRITDAVVFDSFAYSAGKTSVAFTITVIPTENIGEDGMMEIQNKIIETVNKKTGGQIRDK